MEEEKERQMQEGADTYDSYNNSYRMNRQDRERGRCAGGSRNGEREREG